MNAMGDLRIHSWCRWKF